MGKGRGQSEQRPIILTRYLKGIFVDHRKLYQMYEPALIFTCHTNFLVSRITLTLSESYL